MKQIKIIVPALLVGIGLAAAPAMAKDGPQNRGNGHGHGKKADTVRVVEQDHHPSERRRHDDDRNRQYHAQSGKWDNGRREPPSWAKDKDYRSYGYGRVIVVPADQYGRYRLYDPRDGYRWVRDDSGTYMLVSIATGIISDILSRGL